MGTNHANIYVSIRSPFRRACALRRRAPQFVMDRMIGRERPMSERRPNRQVAALCHWLKRRWNVLLRKSVRACQHGNGETIFLMVCLWSGMIS